MAKTKIFISPSTQEHNAYISGGTEEAEMILVAKEVIPYLIAAGFDVKMGGTVSAAANVKMANAWGADIYVAIHSNAGGGDGTVTFYHSTSIKGKKLATLIHNEVAPLSPGKDDGVKANNGLIEIHGPNAPATLIEVAFHDNKKEADWIKANEAAIGKAIAKGILAYYGKGITTPVKPIPVVVKPNPVITIGAKGDAVKKLQTALRKRGFSIDVDGIFGKQTYIAVRRFQRNRGLLIDGIVGKNTWKALGL